MKNHKCLQELILSVKDIDNKGIIFVKNSNDDEFFSYKELFKKAQGFSHYLKTNEIEKGNELIIQFENPKDFIICFWGCLLSGVIPVPVSVAYNEENKTKVANIWKTLNNPYLITTKKIFESLKNVLKNQEINFDNKYSNTIIYIEECSYDDFSDDIYIAESNETAFIQFSSGSTGSPKGVILSHENLIANIEAIIKGIKTTENDSSLSWLPLTHDMGLIGFHLSPLYNKANHIIIPTSLFIKNPLIWMNIANTYKSTVLSSPNFGYTFFLKALKDDINYNWDLSNIRIIFNGAEPISYHICKKFTDKLSKYNLKQNVIFPVYGLAEASLAVSFPNINEDIIPVCIDREYQKYGDIVQIIDYDENSLSFINVGFPIENCSIRVCDVNDNVLPELSIGNIQIKGKNVTKGYYNNVNATKELFTDDNWLKTGDLGFIKDKQLIVTGRVKDLLFFNGQNYYVYDIENAIQKLNDVMPNSVAIISDNDNEIKKDELIIFVINKKEIDDFINLIPKIKNIVNSIFGLDIKYIIPVKKLPFTTSGKLQRYKLKKKYKEGQFDSIINETIPLLDKNERSTEYKEPRDEIENRLVEIWQEVLEIEKIGIDDNFFELGGDSLKAMNIINKVKLEFDYDLEMTIIFNNPIIRVIGDEIRKAIVKEKEIISILEKIEAKVE